MTKSEMISASKYHSDGNDFLILDSNQVEEVDYSHLSKSICTPHRGVGADGCIFILGPFQGRFSLRIFNRDGSEAEMSGNGARCACAFLHHRDLTGEPRVELETRAGIKVYQQLQEGGGFWRYKSSMGHPFFSPAAIPFEAPPTLEKIEDYPVSVDDETVRITALSVGNPQCVVFVDSLPCVPSFEKMGAALENHPLFPNRTNVSFVKVESSHRVRAMIWERGVGPTHSSGTGSCGAAVAAIQTKGARSPVDVHTDTGMQQVEWVQGEEMRLTGRAEFVSDVQFRWPQGD